MKHCVIATAALVALFWCSRAQAQDVTKAEHCTEVAQLFGNEARRRDYVTRERALEIAKANANFGSGTFGIDGGGVTLPMMEREINLVFDHPQWTPDYVTQLAFDSCMRRKARR
jgi:hypothetical protein